MRIETHQGVFADPATLDDVVRAVGGLTEVGEAFIIMSAAADGETYVQAAGTIGADFIVERRDGRAGEHYRADRRMTARELIALLDSYLRGDVDWRQQSWWHRVRVDFGAPQAQA